MGWADCGWEGMACFCSITTIRRLHQLDALPMMSRSTVTALRAQYDHPDGIIASLGERGVLFVRVAGKAK